MQVKILAVDDEEDIRMLLERFMKEEGYEVITAANGQDAVELMKKDTSHEIKLVLLDINMPVMDGITACSMIRETNTIPIMFLTAYSDEENLNRCFQNGADDYLVKPFKKNELSLRIKSLLRRCYEYPSRTDEKVEKSGENQQNDSQEKKLEKGEHGVIQSGNLRIDTKAQKVTLSGNRVSLTYTEYSILRFLAEHAGKVYSISELYEAIWKEPFLTESANTVMVHIRNLRKKMNCEEHSYVNNIWGKGYYFD